MSSLRLIILGIGVLVIAAIYLWEILRIRRQQRQQTIGFPLHDSDEPAMSIRPRQDEEDVSEAISDLNYFLTRAKENPEEPDIANPISPDKDPPPFVRDDLDEGIEPEDADMFPEESDESGTEGAEQPAGYQYVAPEQIITLHITAPPAKVFRGYDIRRALENVGMKHGEMQIFHHFGLGKLQGDRPLFSLADMYEPGSFDIRKIDTHSTRGLALFMCIPTPVGQEVAFELMLNTGQRIAAQLGGELRGPDHKLLDEAHISRIRAGINMFTS